jgi:hypothetical protein
MKKLIAVLLILSPVLVWGAARENPKQMADDFLTTIEKGQVSQAYDNLLKGSSILKNKPDAVAKLEKQTRAALRPYGKILGFDLIKDEKFGSSIVHLVYVLKSEKHFTSWEFYFYKPESEWLVSHVGFNDRFSLLK